MHDPSKPAPRVTVLVVEGRQAVAHPLATALRAEGYDVVRARSARDGLDAARAVHPAVILLGLNLDDMPGVRAIEVFVQQLRVPVASLGLLWDFDPAGAPPVGAIRPELALPSGR